MDRRYAEPLDVRTLARIAGVPEAHVIRTFRATSRVRVGQLIAPPAG